VAVAIKAGETDLSYPAVGLSDYTGMMDFATCSCQPVVTITEASRQVFAVPSCRVVSERSLSVAGLCLNVALLSQQTMLTTFCSRIR